jgi:hypothetical protein
MNKEQHIDAPANLVATMPKAPPPSEHEVRAPFESNMLLTREQENMINERADGWFRALTQSSGWIETQNEDEWLEEGLHSTGGDPLLTGRLRREHFVKRGYYHAIAQNRWEWRQWMYGPDSVFAKQNLNAPLCRRISRAMAAKAINYFFGTKPYFVCYPVGPSDEADAEAMQKVAENKMDNSKSTAALRDAMNTAFDLGESVLKVTHKRRTSLYKKNDVVLGVGGEPVLGEDGEYITEKDGWTLGMDGTQVLTRDGVTLMPLDGSWLSGSFARTVVHYSGPDISEIYYRNFLANWDAATLQEAECCIHLYEVTPAELAAMFTDAKTGVQLLQAVELLREVAETDPVEAQRGVSTRYDAPSSTKIKVQEFWMRCDADGDGITEDICFVRIQAGQGGADYIPLFYDYVQNMTETKERPFYPVVPVRRKGRWTGIGAIEMFEKIQEAVDLMLNRWAFATSSSGHVTIYDPTAFEHTNSDDVDLTLSDGGTLKLKPGRMIDTALKRVYLEDNIGDHWLKIFETFLQLAMNESGVQHANDAAVAGMETTKLATGIRNIEKAGNENFSVFLACLEDGVTDSIRAFVQTLYGRMETEEVARVLEDDVPKIFTVFPRDVQGLQFDVNVLLSRYRSEQMMESVRAVLPDCMTYYTLAPDVQERLAPLFHQLLKAAQVQNPDEIISPIVSQFSPEEEAAAAEFFASMPPEEQQALLPLMKLSQGVPGEGGAGTAGSVGGSRGAPPPPPPPQTPQAPTIPKAA